MKTMKTSEEGAFIKCVKSKSILEKQIEIMSCHSNMYELYSVVTKGWNKY